MIDQFSVSLVTAVVVLVCAVLFVFDTLLRRPEQSGRFWAVGFLSAVLTTMFYLVWASAPDTTWAVVCGNTASVVGTGLMWLGCRAYNRRPVLLPGVAVAVAGAATAVAAAVEFALGGDDWSGAFVMFAALSVLAAAASAECFRGALRSSRNALPLGLVFGIQGLFYLVRVVVVATQGYGETFHLWVGTIATSILTVVLSITAVVAASVLRAGRAGVRGSEGTDGRGAGPGEIATVAGFQRAVAISAERARARRELIAVWVIELDGLEYIATAFGLDVADEVVRTWRGTMTANAPTLAILGEVGSERIGVVTVVGSAADARRQAMALYRSLFESLGSIEGGVLPAIGVGVALSDVVGYDPDALIEVAATTATRASSGVASAVLLAEPA
ncbi:diguanylate cyclase [Microbacterium sp. cf332]|uniref:diguanylate cyclase n=1 Tax=Microbacterium sp. cf332 TaxID=1761804 RepID=UPI00088FBE21|nr:diguanylate cyclase [Microbacterium sp. cf332]SDQ17926.1 GGDEF domain-containing protein, diguanylate cyclase (c-di-GMP synthetase) or its enzymatically inactive variants [Microbacterium sp. cf332]